MTRMMAGSIRQSIDGMGVDTAGAKAFEIFDTGLCEMYPANTAKSRISLRRMSTCLSVH